MKLSCSSQNLHDGDLEARAREFTALGIRHIEVIARGPKDPVDLATAEPDDIAGPLRKHGLDPVALYSASLNVTEESAYQRSVSVLKRAADLAEAVGAGRLVTTPFGPNQRDGYDYRKLANACREVADHIGDRPITLCLENHPGWPLTYSRDYEALFTHIGDDRVAITLDFAHLVRLGEDPLGFARTWVDRIRHIHLKDSDGEKTVKFGEGIAPIRETLDFLRGHGYDGYASLELEIPGVPGTPENLGEAWEYCRTHYCG